VNVEEIRQIAYDSQLKTIDDIHAAAEKLATIRAQYQPGSPEHIACQETIESLTHYAMVLNTANRPA